MYLLAPHCIKYRHDSLLDITAWAQEHFQKSLSVKRVPQMQVKVVSCKEEAQFEQDSETPPSSQDQSSSKMVCGKMENCFVVIKILNLFWKPCHTCPADSRGEGPSSVSLADGSKAFISDGMGLHQCLWRGQLHLEMHH